MLEVTLKDLKTQVRQRANMENSKFVTDAEVTGYINKGYSALYDLLVSKGEHYFAVPLDVAITADTTYDQATPPGVVSYHLQPLPDDFYKLVGIDYLLGTQRYPMQKFSFLDRNKYRYNSQVVRYRIMGDKIMFTPKPSPQTITMWYVPVIAPLSSDTDALDGVNGWEDYVVVDAAIRCLVKEESDTSALEREKMALIKRIEDMASARDHGFNERVGDVTGLGYPDAYWIGER